MKKTLSLVFMALFPLFAMAQKVDVKVDDFTGEKVITTEWEKIYSGGMTGKNQTRARFRHENGKDYMELRVFTNGVAACAKDAKVMFKTDSGIVELLNTKSTLAEPGAWHPSGINDNLGIYLVFTGKMGGLETALVSKMRVYYTDGYVDTELKEKDSKKLNKLYDAFIKAKE